MERQNVEWSSPRRECQHCLRYFDYIKDLTSESSEVRDRSDLSGEHTQEHDEILDDIEIHRNDHN